MTLLGRRLVPFASIAEALVHARSALIEAAKQVLCVGVSLSGEALHLVDTQGLSGLSLSCSRRDVGEQN
jgi:hypothetical protein